MINVLSKKKPYKVRLIKTQYIVLNHKEYDESLNRIYQQTKQELKNGENK